MNKIIIANDNHFELNDCITIEQSCDLINKIKLTVLKNTSLEIIIKNDQKIEFQIKVEDNVKLNLKEIKLKSKIKALFKYELGKNSNLNLIKICDTNTINERSIINLNKDNAKVYCLLKSVSQSNKKYDFLINHNSSNTISEIITNGLNIKGSMIFNVTTFIPKDSINCIANQNNRIINLNNEECVIRPNLLIDNENVSANHSALIGTFKDDEIFYLNRLGLNYEKATKLLIEGFIKNGLSNKLANYFKKYWR